ncbi:hypothetical protein N7489_008335 [Penicillium chrysogenum]|uniref:Uncharacterized protein n=1 Tax=Penicillium chrysogenum TaxID=5076 RepID=A0ABQ8W9H8_PENCH|nr:uncharacterized protein N7489_008335 [Penicillium chrysogenum]KAJ5238244.1 hypothetical protein N7489_008335 [Penicillium chrysogenum]KAJ5261486.1 hypothetical protein N7505_008353 [Penicillium chrysogenum]KAJ5278549.1 hypothetical protein N7524_004702 [Penicillium chrysogenum]KAJ6159410.1 hypothetical protein N7497_003947 [Penicillium chrysogenum]
MKVPLAPTEHPNQVLRKLGSPYDPELPLSFAFGLIGLQRGWKPGSKTWKKNWNACMNCEYDRLIGCRVTSLTTWQQLCAKLGIKDSFKSINQCKKALARVHVNIVDLLDSWNSDTIPMRFQNKEALATYTKSTQKFFGRHIAKQDKVLRVLLRKLL